MSVTPTPVSREAASNPPPTPNDRPAVWDLVIDDMDARNRFGTAKYGTPLQAFNGRNSLQVVSLVLFGKVISRLSLASH